MQGSIIKTIMTSNESQNNRILLTPKPEYSPSLEDLNLLLTVSKQFGKTLDIDELMNAFVLELFKKNEKERKVIEDAKKLEDEWNNRFIVALLHLVNAGMFEQVGHSKQTLKRTFYGKVIR